MAVLETIIFNLSITIYIQKENILIRMLMVKLDSQKISQEPIIIFRIIEQRIS